MGTVAAGWMEVGSVVALWVFIALGLGIALAPMARAIVRGQRLIMEEPTPEGRDHPQERPEPLAIEASPYIERHDYHGRRFRIPPYVPQPEEPPELEETGPLHISKWASSGDKTQPPRKVW